MSVLVLSILCVYLSRASIIVVLFFFILPYRLVRAHTNDLLRSAYDTTPHETTECAIEGLPAAPPSSRVGQERDPCDTSPRGRSRIRLPTIVVVVVVVPVFILSDFAHPDFNGDADG